MSSDTFLYLAIFVLGQKLTRLGLSEGTDKALQSEGTTWKIKEGEKEEGGREEGRKKEGRKREAGSVKIQEFIKIITQRSSSYVHDLVPAK